MSPLGLQEKFLNHFFGSFFAAVEGNHKSGTERENILLSVRTWNAPDEFFLPTRCIPAGGSFVMEGIIHPPLLLKGEFLSPFRGCQD